MKIEPGAIVDGRYEIVRSLGQGSATTVFEARDRKFEAQVALRVAVDTGEAYHERLARFQREVRIGHLLGNRPGFVRALDWGQLPDRMTLFLVLDLIQPSRGLDLSTGPLSARVRALETVASRMTHAHALGIVHRDLRPESLLVGSDDTIYVADFGQAKIDADDPDGSTIHITKPGTLIGTPAYMAPEQFSDPSHVNSLADVYSLGVMLFVALTGELPFPGRTPFDIMSRQVQVRYGEVPPPRPSDLATDVDPLLEQVCLEAIELERERRLPSAEALLSRFRSWREDRPQGPLWQRLGLDEEGFIPVERLRTSLGVLGEEAFLARLGGAPALLVESERPIQGVKQYEGRVTFLLQRSTGEPGSVISLGRTLEADLTLDLVTISNPHLKLRRRGSDWTVTDCGSHNGSACDGAELEPRAPRPIRSGSLLELAAKHLALRFLSPAALVAALRA